MGSDGGRLRADRAAVGRGRTIAAAGATVLTSTGLYPIFSGGSWFWAGVGAVLSVAGAAGLTRLRRLPVPVCLLGGLAGLLLYLNLVFAHGQSLAALLPTPTSLGYLANLAGQGLSESSRYAPPVPELSGMMLLSAGGVGLTALLVDLIAVRLGSAALAGLPLLLLFTEPFTLSVSRGWLGTTVVFCFATAGYLTLLGTEGRERIREWEQPRSGWPQAAATAVPSGATASGRGAAGPPTSGPSMREHSTGGGAVGGLREGRAPDTSSLAAAGRRVGIASVVVALCVPLFVPGLHATRLFGGGTSGIGGYGNGSVGFPDPQTQISGELRSGTPEPVLSYSSSAAEPDYLQVYVLGSLTTRGWQFTPGQPPVAAGATVPAPPGLAASAGTQRVTTHVTVSKNAAQDPLAALPAPYPPVRADADGDLRADRGTLMLFDPGTQLAGLSYSVTSLDVAPSEEDLAGAPPPPKRITDRYMSVPQSYAPLRALADTITTGATTPYAKAIDLQNWFTDGNFGYSLSAPTIANANALQNFLNNSHTGYCQQFSFAMAVLARLAGIPSRIAYGFTQGSRQRGGGWQVTTHDAHAWPELYFQGYGWLRFEPTPGGANGQGTATAPVYTAPQTPSAPSAAAPLPNPGGAAGGAAGSGAGQSVVGHGHQFADDGDGGAALPAPAPGGPGPWQLAGLSVLGLLAVLATLPGCARTVVRRRRWRRAAAGTGDRTDAALADAAWRELRDDLADHRAGCPPSESPRALARRIAGELELSGGTAQALHRITMAAERALYSARPSSGATLRRDSAMVRRAIAAAVPRRTRWRARMFPSSVLIPAAVALGQVTEALGRLRIGGNRLRGRTAT